MLYGHVEGIPPNASRTCSSSANIKTNHWPGRQSLRSKTSAAEAPGAAFNCCIPLSFIPDGSEFGDLPGPTGLDDLRTLAVARLMLDNIPHVKAFWIMQSPKLAQVALDWGVDDFDGTVVWYDITKREGPRHQSPGTHRRPDPPPDARSTLRAGRAGFGLQRTQSFGPGQGRATLIP